MASEFSLFVIILAHVSSTANSSVPTHVSVCWCVCAPSDIVHNVSGLLIWIKFHVYSVCPVLIMTVYFRKKQQTFEVLGQVDPRNNVDVDPDPPREEANFWGNGWCSVTYRQCGLFPNYYGNFVVTLLSAQKSSEFIFNYSRPRGRPKKTWREIVEKDCQAHKLNGTGGGRGIVWIILDG